MSVKEELHEAVDRLDDVEARAVLESVRARRLDAFLAGVPEEAPDEWDREMLAGITDEDRDPANSVSLDDVKAELGL